MRDIERILIALNLAGSLVMGARQETLWFLAPLIGFGLYVVLADRLLRRNIGTRAWPSEGYARFAFNTNLYFVLKHMTLGALVFALAGGLA